MKHLLKLRIAFNLSSARLSGVPGTFFQSEEILLLILATLFHGESIFDSNQLIQVDGLWFLFREEIRLSH